MSGPRAPRLLSRRRVLRLGAAAGAAALPLSGCDLDPRSPAAPVSPHPGPDDDIVAAARAELRGLLTRLDATPGAADLVACHQVQLATLGGHPPTRRRRGRSLTPTQLVARERRAVTRFERWARSSRDGDLARLLACIAAGIATQPQLQGPT